MTSLAPASRKQLHRLRLVVSATLGLIPAIASAQEPLFIRIRPLSEAEAARVAREAVWARRQAHARTVIESVCTGCLGAWKPAVEPAPTAPPAPTPDDVANLTVRIGVELDPGPVASDLPDSSTSERHP